MDGLAKKATALAVGALVAAVKAYQAVRDFRPLRPGI